MLNANQVKAIYTDYVNQADAEKQQRAINAATDIIGDYAAGAAMGQRIHFAKVNDIPRDIVYPVKDELEKAGFTVKTRWINGHQVIEIRF